MRNALAWILVLALAAVVLVGCETGARYVLDAVDPCGDCYLEPPGQVADCLQRCRQAEEAPEDPCAPCAELPKGKRARCFEECEGTPPDSTGAK